MVPPVIELRPQAVAALLSCNCCRLLHSHLPMPFISKGLLCTALQTRCATCRCALQPPATPTPSRPRRFARRLMPCCWRALAGALRCAALRCGKEACTIQLWLILPPCCFTSPHAAACHRPVCSVPQTARRCGLLPKAMHHLCTPAICLPMQLQVGQPAQRTAPREGPAAPALLPQRVRQPAARGGAAAAGGCLHPQARGGLAVRWCVCAVQCWFGGVEWCCRSWLMPPPSSVRWAGWVFELVRVRGCGPR